MRIRNIVITVFLVASSFGYAQFEYSGSANLEGYYSSEDDLPFWFYSNQRGRVSEDTNIDGWINAKLNYNFSEFSNLAIGGGILYQDEFSDEVFIDELYADFKYKWLQVIAGRKQESELYNGLSATNENILWSLNARPMPGFQLKTVEPIYFKSGDKLAFEASWNEYYLGDNQGAEKVRLHHKELRLIYQFEGGWTAKAGIQHFVQWGGISENYGQQPQGFTDYLRIIAGRGGGGNSAEREQANALGNHLGSWELYLTKATTSNKFRFIYNNLFEDGSGSRFANIPDGRYGFYIEKKDKHRLVNSFIYEFYYTRDQSQTGPHLFDNYFNNGVYSFGWTYKDKVIGVPFFTYSAEENYVINNKISAHHIGIGGQFSNYSQSFPYKILLTYRHNEGTFSRTLNSEGLNEEVFNFYSKWRVLNLPVKADLSLGLDINSAEKPIFGAGISLSRQF